MTGSTLNTLAANPAIFYRPIIRSSSFRDYFLLKNIFIEPTPTPPCSKRFRHPFFESTPQRVDWQGEGSLLRDVIINLARKETIVITPRTDGAQCNFIHKLIETQPFRGVLISNTKGSTT